MASKISKNNPSVKTATPKVKLALSTECEACVCQCSKGLAYISKIKSGKIGHGVVCKK